MKKWLDIIADRWFFLRGFFPLKLLMLHLRRSHLLLVFWAVLVGFFTGAIGQNYGFHYLFLSPEYLQEVNFGSFALMGLTLGLFVMAFHINSYIYYSYRFPFLATLSRPLWKFSINNSIIPLLFYLGLSGAIVRFGLQEDWALLDFVLRLGGLYAGSIVSIGFTFTYFLSTIRTLDEPPEGQRLQKGVRTLQNLIKLGRQSQKVSQRHPVAYYLKSFFQVRLTRQAHHYQEARLLKTIEQHHLSAAFFFLLLILLVIGLSWVTPNRLFRIPAGATVFLIFSLYLMVVGALYSRFKTWTVSLGLLLLVGVNYLSGLPPFYKENYAYGLKYQGQRASYTPAAIDSLVYPQRLRADRQASRDILRHWVDKQKEDKPLLVLLNVSGGGQRSALWTYRVLQALDSASGGQFFPRVHLIAGSSGGMLGAAYYRSLAYQAGQGGAVDPQALQHRQAMGSDMLNAVTFYLAVNDLFFRLNKVSYAGRTYLMDRGYAFDERLNEITRGRLDTHFNAFAEAERRADMPQLILAPTIVNDGRKLLMSPQGLSYLTHSKPWSGYGRPRIYDAVEYGRLFARQQPDSLRFLTALRMSASFPYITPLVNLPSEPRLKLIDAGVRDNEGLELSLRYLYHHRAWLQKRIRGVLVVQVKANRQDSIEMDAGGTSRLAELVQPISGVVRSFGNFQTYNKGLLMEWSETILDFPLYTERMVLPLGQQDVSLSWHLTRAEKSTIAASLHTPPNRKTLQRIMALLSPKRPPKKEEAGPSNK